MTIDVEKAKDGMAAAIAQGESTFTVFKPEKMASIREALEAASAAIQQGTSEAALEKEAVLEQLAQSLGARPGWVTESGTLALLVQIAVDRLCQIMPIEQVSQLLMETLGVVALHAQEREKDAKLMEALNGAVGN